MFFANSFMGSVELAIVIKLILAALAGGLVGLEREKHGRPAGMRTNLLVSVGACTIMLISEAFYLKYGLYGADTTLRMDPSRTAAQIVTGIGFLGAGVIVKEGATVRGLTTAATLWVVAGLGMAFGMGFFSLGGISTVLVIASLVFLRKFDSMIHKDRYLTLSVTGERRDNLFDELMKLLKDMELKASDISSQVDLVKNEILIKMVLTRQRERVGQELSAAVEKLEGIKKVFYR